MSRLALIAALFVVFGAGTVFAASPKALAPCSPAQLRELERSIAEWGADGYPHAAYLLNQRRAVVGYFAWDDSDGMHAEVCDGVVHRNMTVSNHWYYWNSPHGRSNPATWRQGQWHELQQDEGLAGLKVLRASRGGNVVCELTVSGWNDSSDIIVVRRDVVSFVRK